MAHSTTRVLSLLLCGRSVLAFVHPRTSVTLPIVQRLYSSSFSDQDEHFLDLAVQHARNGLGHTFPNPAVGCVIVEDSSETVIGAGFHPQSGMPHAEVFALLQAAGHVADGVEAAKSIVHGDNPELLEQVNRLTDDYLSASGPATLFADACSNGESTTTAYVTLEPCCHVGKTPPCASSLVLAQVDRVVVGFRDPNPCVDGGGFKVLEDAGVEVLEAQGPSNRACADLVTNFCKRITPRDDDIADYDTTMTGAKRRALRALSGRLKMDNALTEVAWGGPSIRNMDDLESAVAGLPLKPSWMEATDDLLWQHELILLRLNNAVAKKKGAKLLGERIADQLGAHVAQVVGHTALLYRPSVPPVLDLEFLSKPAVDNT